MADTMDISKGDAPELEVTLEELVSNIGDLPTLPTVVVKIARMTSNPQTNAADVGKLISNDPSLSAKILKLVNSAYYGFPRKVNSVTKAIVLLGFNKVKNMALSAAVVDAFQNTRKTKYFDFFHFWEHSVASGIAAETIAKALAPHCADDAFVGGLLHDIGKVVIANHVEHSDAVFTRAVERKVVFADAANELLKYDQAVIGSLLAEHWSFPELLSKIIRHWQAPDKIRQHRDVIGCVHLGNVIVSGLGITGEGDHAMPLVSNDIWRELNVTEEVMENLCQDTLRGFANAAAFIDLAKDGA